MEHIPRQAKPDDTGSDIARLLAAMKFAADKHRDQRRKDPVASPYINHPIVVAEVLARAGVADIVALQAAILHDTIEDTDTTPEEIERNFGREVLDIVLEMTDDKSLPKDVRKRLQVERASRISTRAKLVKLGDKIANIIDVTHAPPMNWSHQ
jgi:guanosine-3',5'-bis(diphosphate) 3'-pyrophosphohydrolase